MSVADDIRLYPHFEIPSRLTSRLEDVHYRFALADTDEKLEKTLKVDSVSHGCLPKIYLVPTLLKLNTTSQPVIHKVAFDRFAAKPRSSQYAAISRNE